MPKTLDAIDVADDPVLERLVDEVSETGAPRILRRDGEVVAMIIPIALARSLLRSPISEAGRQAFLASAGSWSGNVDVEQFKADNAESRRLSTRPSAPTRRSRPTPEQDRAALRSVAGGWKGLVDADRLVEEVYADRRLSDRPPVEW